MSHEDIILANTIKYNMKIFYLHWNIVLKRLKYNKL